MHCILTVNDCDADNGADALSVNDCDNDDESNDETSVEQLWCTYNQRYQQHAAIEARKDARFTVSHKQ